MKKVSCYLMFGMIFSLSLCFAQTPQNENVLTGTGEVITDLFFLPLASGDIPKDQGFQQMTDSGTCASHCSIQRKSNLNLCKRSQDEFCEYSINQNYLDCEKTCEDKKMNPPDIANPLFEKTRMPAGSPFEEKFPF